MVMNLETPMKIADEGFTMAKRQQLWCEAAQTATMLDNILVQDSTKSPPLLNFLE